MCGGVIKVYCILMLLSWSKGLYNGTKSNYVCRWNLHHWETAWTTKWEAEWLKQLAGSHWISRGVVALHLRKGKTFPGQTSKVLVWLRQQTAECSRGAGARNRNSRKTKPTRSCNKKAVDMPVYSLAHTHTKWAVQLRLSGWKDLIPNLFFFFPVCN